MLILAAVRINGANFVLLGRSINITLFAAAPGHRRKAPPDKFIIGHQRNNVSVVIYFQYRRLRIPSLGIRLTPAPSSQTQRTSLLSAISMMPWPKLLGHAEISARQALTNCHLAKRPVIRHGPILLHSEPSTKTQLALNRRLDDIQFNDALCFLHRSY